jgi:PRTRC genetic system protein E
MLFTKLFPLLVSSGLVLDIKQTEGDKIKLIIKFKVTDEKSAEINLNPLVLEGTPEEFDNGLIDSLIEEMKVSIPSILSQVNVLTLNLKKVLDEKTNASKAKVTKTVKKEEEKKDDLFAKQEDKTDKKPVKKRRTKAEMEAAKKTEESVEEPKTETPAEIKEDLDLDLGLNEPKTKTSFELLEEISQEEAEKAEETIDRLELDNEDDDDDNPFA